ncbi:hypothetical protein BJX68DRAFT_246270 [Aspergillus pseudodeflectus]|uniref:Uncharacterized protein n=1 Tax=Aspergillus pseudodeflectus TaxID=176178 RepID=A0ABR4JLD5_9EURO
MWCINPSSHRFMHNESSCVGQGVVALFGDSKDLEFGIGVREPVVLYAGQSTPLTYPRYFVECPHVGSRSLAATSNLKLEERAGLLQIVWTLPGNLRTHVYMYEHLTYTRRVLGGREPRQRIICPCKPPRRGTVNGVRLRILKNSSVKFEKPISRGWLPVSIGIWQLLAPGTCACY